MLKSSGNYVVVMGSQWPDIDKAVISVPFVLSAAKHSKRAIEVYNAKPKNSSLNMIQMNFMVKANGVGLKVTF